MNHWILLGIFTALATGVAIGVQTTLATRIGTMIGTIQTGVLMNIAGGLVASLVLVILLIFKGKGIWQVPGTAVVMLFIAGTLGVLIVTGISFSLQKSGVAAGLASVILGQMLVSLIVDVKGWAGAPPIPITLPRIAGLVIIAAGVLLLLPRKG